MRGREWQVFLFEQNIIFSETVGKKTQFTNPVYIYKAHIQVRSLINLILISIAWPFFCFWKREYHALSNRFTLHVGKQNES